jgi:hypothetical protein
MFLSSSLSVLRPSNRRSGTITLISPSPTHLTSTFTTVVYLGRVAHQDRPLAVACQNPTAGFTTVPATRSGLAVVSAGVTGVLIQWKDGVLKTILSAVSSSLVPSGYEFLDSIFAHI